MTLTCVVTVTIVLLKGVTLSLLCGNSKITIVQSFCDIHC